MRSPRGWTGLLRSVGRSMWEVLEAEGAALGHDLTRTGRGLLIAVALFGAATVFVFWLVGVLTIATIEGLTAVMPRWTAALVVGAVLLLGALVLLGLGRRRLRRLESPSDTVRRHVDDHLAWWHDRVLEAPPPAAELEEAARPTGGEEA